MPFIRYPSLRRFFDALVPPSLQADPVHLHTARRLVALHIAMFGWLPAFAVLNYLIDAPLSAIILSGAMMAPVTTFAALWLSRSPAVCGDFVGLTAWILYTSLALVNGGLNAPVLMWYTTIPALTLLMSGAVRSIVWTTICVLTIVVLYGMDYYDFPVYNELTPATLSLLRMASNVGLIVCSLTLAWVLNAIEVLPGRSLREENVVLQQKAATDPLTGFANRGELDEVLEAEFRRHQRVPIPLSLLMLDIDFFKELNDSAGHFAGDSALQLVADAIRSRSWRAGDFIARYGGDEFVIILSNCGAAAAVNLANELCSAVRKLDIHHPDAPAGRLSISVGAATALPSREGSPLELLREADAALYMVKDCGRDGAQHFDTIVAASL